MSDTNNTPPASANTLTFLINFRISKDGRGSGSISLTPEIVKILSDDFGFEKKIYLTTYIDKKEAVLHRGRMRD